MIERTNLESSWKHVGLTGILIVMNLTWVEKGLEEALGEFLVQHGPIHSLHWRKAFSK